MNDKEMQGKMEVIVQQQARLSADEGEDRARILRLEEAFRTLVELQKIAERRLDALEEWSERTREWAERTEELGKRTEEWAERIRELEERAREWGQRAKEWAEFTEGRLDGFDEKMALLIEAQTGTQATLRELAAAQTHTDDRLNILIDVVERYISKRSNGNAQS